jgi:hypothetical protein
VYLPNDAPADADGCRRSCTTQFRIVCRPDQCFNCSYSAQICAAPTTFDASGSVTLTTSLPACICRPGSNVTRGCVTLTCNAQGTGFTEVRDTTRCCAAGAIKTTACNNTCLCNTDTGAFECTTNPCTCTDGTVRFSGCKRCACSVNFYVFCGLFFVRFVFSGWCLGLPNERLPLGSVHRLGMLLIPIFVSSKYEKRKEKKKLIIVC